MLLLCKSTLLSGITGKIGIIIIEQISGLFVYVICSIQFEKLDSDLKNYKSNSIKESIR